MAEPFEADVLSASAIRDALATEPTTPMHIQQVSVKLLPLSFARTKHFPRNRVFSLRQVNNSRLVLMGRPSFGSPREGARCFVAGNVPSRGAEVGGKGLNPGN